MGFLTMSVRTRDSYDEVEAASRGTTAMPMMVRR